MYHKALAYTLVGVLNSLTLVPEPIQTQLSDRTDNIAVPVRINFRQPDVDSAPSGRPRGTGSRGDCPVAELGTEGEFTLTPLLPLDGRGLTVTESPTIWIHVSYKGDRVETPISGEFSLEDFETHRKLPPHQVPVTLPRTSGSFSIQLPHPLEVNKWYRWYLVLDCRSSEPTNGDAVLSVEGLVQRVELPVTSRSETQTSQERIGVYADGGIWYDALNEAARFYCHNPQAEGEQPWTALLNDDEVEFEEVAGSLPICQP